MYRGSLKLAIIPALSQQLDPYQRESSTNDVYLQAWKVVPGFYTGCPGIYDSS